MTRQQATEKAKATLRKLSLEKLVEQFELTTTINDPHIAEVRGWLMDVIEEKAPEGFSKWLDNDTAEDTDLKKYVLA